MVAGVQGKDDVEITNGNDHVDNEPARRASHPSLQPFLGVESCSGKGRLDRQLTTLSEKSRR